MVKRKFMVALTLGARMCLGVFLSACSSPTNSAEVASQKTDLSSIITDEAVSKAIDETNSTGALNDSIVTLSYDGSEKVIHGDMLLSTDDTKAAIQQANQALRNFSSNVLAQAKTLGQNDEDDSAASKIEEAEAFDKTHEDALGTLYDYYGISMHVDNEAGTLALDGQREAGANNGINWQ